MEFEGKLNDRLFPLGSVYFTIYVVLEANPDIIIEPFDCEQLVGLFGMAVITGTGFTVTTSVNVFPTQFPAAPEVGVTIYVAD